MRVERATVGQVTSRANVFAGPHAWCALSRTTHQAPLTRLCCVTPQKHTETRQVKDRFTEAKRRKEEADAGYTGPTAAEAYQQRLAAQAEEEARRKRQRREAKEAKKNEEQARELEEMDPEIMAMMGFGGFGGSNKK